MLRKLASISVFQSLNGKASACCFCCFRSVFDCKRKNVGLCQYLGACSTEFKRMNCMPFINQTNHHLRHLLLPLHLGTQTPGSEPARQSKCLSIPIRRWSTASLSQSFLIMATFQFNPTAQVFVPRATTLESRLNPQAPAFTPLARQSNPSNLSLEASSFSPEFSQYCKPLSSLSPLPVFGPSMPVWNSQLMSLPALPPAVPFHPCATHFASILSPEPRRTIPALTTKSAQPVDGSSGAASADNQPNKMSQHTNHVASDKLKVAFNSTPVVTEGISRLTT